MTGQGKCVKSTKRNEIIVASDSENEREVEVSQWTKWKRSDRKRDRNGQ